MASGDTMRIEVMAHGLRKGGYAWVVQGFRGGRQRILGQGSAESAQEALSAASERAAGVLEAELG